MSTETPPVTGLVAGKYALVRMIGRGGMGSVWEGKHATLGTRVAIKFIESEYTDNEEARSRFDTEAKAAAQLQSKHAIQVYDHGVTPDGKPYIVMEFLQGEPLDKRIERYRRLPLQDVARIMNQVARALGRAHELGITHRDLKPENIYLVRTQDDDDEIAKVLDFGIAKIKNNAQDHGVSSSTKTGAVLGTPYYMSPEQARGLRTIDHRTDLWSLGVIAYKCVTGVLPFDGESLGDLLVKICTAPLPVPSQAAPGLPPAFDAWFARALDREPTRRFSTALELADALSLAAGVSVRRTTNQTSQPNLPQYQGGTGTMAGGPQVMGGASPAPYAQHGGTPQPYAQSGGTGTQRPYGTPNPYATPQMQTPQPGYGPGATSAPFTSAAPTPKSGMGAGFIAAIVVALVLGVGAGIFGLVKLSTGEANAGGGSTATATVTAPTTPPSTVLPIPTVATTDTAPLATINTTATARPTATGTTRPTATATATGRPTATTTTTTTATATATATATTKPTTTATVTAHPTTTSTGIGPGF